MAKRYFISRFQINHSYGSQPYSEYYTRFFIIQNQTQLIPQLYPRKIHRWKKISLVPKKDIGKELLTWYLIKNNPENKNLYFEGFANNIDYRLIGITFEYDWWARPKRVITIRVIGLTGGKVDLEIKSSKEYEYYQIFNIDLSSLQNGQGVNFPGKGFVRIQRSDSYT